MKYILALIAILSIASLTAQNTIPRFGITKSQDNTGRALNYNYINTSDVAQAALDTILLSPNAWLTVVTPSVNLNDSVCYKFSSNTGSYRVGDQVVIMVSKGTGAGKIKFGGSKYILSTGSAAVAIAANKSATIRFRWCGTCNAWIEESRVVQP
jgi:hypothetical protein